MKRGPDVQAKTSFVLHILMCRRDELKVKGVRLDVSKLEEDSQVD